MNRIITLLVLMIVIGVKGWGQNVTVSGALTGNGTYATLSSAFTAIGISQSGTNIIISITGNTTEPAGGAVLGAGTWSALKITPSGSRIITGAATAGLPLINLNGADNVTIDGLNSGGNALAISNTTVSATAGTSTIQFINDATSNIIQNCTIAGSATVANSVTVAGGDIVFSLGTGTGNDGNIINNNTITAAGANLPSCAIYSLGTSIGIDNSGIQVTNNNIQDYFAPGGNSFGLFVGNYSSAWTITGNNFFQSAMRTATTGNTHEAIKINTSGVTSGNGYIISNNTIGYANGGTTPSGTTSYAGNTASRFIGIDLSVGTTTASGVQGNVISNISLSTTSNAASAYGIFTGIYVSGGNVNIGTTAGNTIGATTGTGSIAITSTASGLISGITSSSTGTVSILNNNIGSIATGGTATIGYTLYGINTSGTSGNCVISGNTIGSTATANSIAVGTSGTTTTGPCIFNGITNTATGAISITGNTIQNCSSFGTGASGITGIVSAAASNSTVSLNTVNALICTGTVAAIGINTSAGTTTNVFKNKIFDISNSNASGTVSGILVSGGSTISLYNNIIGDLRTANANAVNPLVGINITGGTPVNVYYNTVYLNGNSTGTLFGSSAVSASPSSAITLRNNIFANTSSVKGSALAVAYRRSNVTLTSYNAASNNNDFYGTSAIYTDGTNTDVTLALFKTRVAARDAASVSENPLFVSTTGVSPVYLHINNGVGTRLESGGATIASFADDYDGDIRQGSAGYIGSGTAPDIGADEFNGVPPDITPPAISYTPVATACAGSNVTLTATITDAGGVPTSGTGLPFLYYKINSGSYTAVQGVSIGSSQYTFTFGGSTVGADVVSYYIVAQDNANSPNISSYPAGAAGFTANPPAASTPPSTPSTFVAGYILNGNYTVGTGGNFTTLTAAVSAYNNACNITGAVTFTLLNNIATGETFPITINASNYSGATNALTIKPNTSGLNITGSSASGLIVLNGADYVIIDGSVSGTANSLCPLSAASRNLTLTNTNTSSASAVIWLQTTAGADAATNNTIKNCIISGSSNIQTLFGIGSGSPVISIGSPGTGNNNNSFINNSISKTQYGIYSQGTDGTIKNTGTIINQNIINAVSPNNVLVGGIYVGYENNITISGNNISNISGANTYAWGISCGLVTFNSATTTGNDVTNAVITKNTIGTIRPAGTYGVAGIGMASVTSGTNIIANNIISDAFTNGTSGDIGAAIYIGGGTGSTTNIFYNAVTMAGNLGGATDGNFALAINGDNPIVNIKNNIFTNTGSNGANLKAAIGLAYTTITNLSSNYNDLYVSGAGAAIVQTGSLSNSGYTSYGTVTGAGSWNEASGKDANSLNILPAFNSATDLRLTAANADLNNAGIPVSVTNDIDCAARNPSTPDIGVNEFLSPNSPVINIVSLSTPSNCNAIAHIITANITSGTNPITSVKVMYYFNGSSQTPVSMTGGSATGTSVWTASIPAAVPVNAAVTWNVTAIDGTVTSDSVSGTLYQDAPLAGISLVAGSSASAVCSDGSFNLTAAPDGLPVFSQGFEGSFPPSGWTFINAGFGNSWSASTASHTGTEAMSYTYSATDPANAWSITPVQNLIAGKTYTISFWYEVGLSAYPEKLKVTVGTAATVAAQTTILWNNNGGSSLTNTNYAKATILYTPASSGIYYFGFNCYSDANEFSLYVDDISIAANFNYAWSSSPAGFTSNSQNPIGVTETVATTYNVTATYNGCSVTSPGVTISISSPLSGIYSVGSGNIAGQAGHYATLTAAISAYNSICLGGPVVFALTDAIYNTAETFPVTINANSSAGSVNTLTIKPNTGINAVISGNNASALLRLNSADYITIDGSNTINGTTQNLSFSNTNSGTSNVIWINSVASPADGATHDTVRNCKIAGLDYADNFAGIAATGSVNLTNAEAPNSFNAVINNVFIRSQEGIAILGCNTGNDNGWYISGNSMGSSVTADQMAFDGISVNNVQNFNVTSNIITGIVVNSFDLAAGIYVDGNISNGSISNNKISNIKNSSTSFQDGSAGIYLGAASTASNLSVYNNFISDVASYGAAGFTVNDNGNGIVIDAGGGYNIYYNTVNLTTNQTTGTSAALWISPSITTGNSLSIRDNIFANNQSANTRYSVYSTAPNTIFAAMDYNDYWNTGTNLAYNGSALADLAAVKSAAGFGTSNNMNSQKITPVFISATDLHLNTSSNAALNNLGTAISTIITDIDNDSRNTINPDVGADEFSTCSPTLDTWTGAINTDWNTAGNWCGGIPTLATSVMIPSGLNNYPVISNADDVAASVTVNSAASLTMNGTGNLTMSNGSIFTNNGTYTSTGSTGAVIFAGSASVSGTVSFNNVTINGPVDFGSTGVSTVTGNLIINSGGSAIGFSTHVITYTSSSTLIYNTTVTTSNEWFGGNSGTLSAGIGIPQNVIIKSGTVTITNTTGAAGGTADRGLAGSLTIASGANFQTTTRDIYIAGDWINNAGSFNANTRKVSFNGGSNITQTLSGNTTFYDLSIINPAATGIVNHVVNFGTAVVIVAGTFSNDVATMNGNMSTVIFSGASGAIIGSAAKNFYNLQINNPGTIIHTTGGGNIHISNSFINNGSLTENAAYTFYFDSSGTTPVIETLSGTGNTTFGNLTIGAGINIGSFTTLNTGNASFTITGNALSFNHTGASLNSTGIITFALSTAGTCTIKNAMSVTGTAANFGSVQLSTIGSTVVTSLDFGSGISTISNSLTINNNGSLITNAPLYGSTSTLVYNTSTSSFTTGLEWSANTITTGAGNPQNVTIKNTNNILLAGDRGLNGNLDIASGDILNLNDHTFTLNGAVSSTGAFIGSASSGLILNGTAGTIHFTPGGTTNVLQTFTINAAASVTLGDSLYMTAGNAFGTLTADGTISTDDHLVLRSNVNGTARVATSAGTINGNVTVERYIATGTGSAPNHSKSWQLLATPTIGQTVKASWQEDAMATNISAPPAPSAGNPLKGYGTMITSDIPGSDAQPAPGFDIVTPNGPSVKIYDYSTNGYDGIISTSLPVYNKHGYFVFVRGDRSVFTSSGTATPTVLRTTGRLFTVAAPPPVDTVIAGKFQSIGNPYASAIDMRDVTLSGGVNPFFYVWDPRLGGLYNYGAFQTFSKSGGNYVNLLSSPTYGAAGTINNYIQSGQAFLMQATGMDGTVSFTEGAKASGIPSTIFARESSVPGNDTSLRTTLYNVNTDGTPGGIVDGVFNEFSVNYCNCVDGLDARKSANTGESLSIITDDTLLVIERRPTIIGNDTIFLYLTGERQQQYQFGFDALNLRSNVEGFVEDTYTNTRIPFNLSGHTAMNFTVDNNTASVVPGRFRIVFSPLQVLPVTFVFVKAYKNIKNINVKWRVNNERNIRYYEVEKSINGTDFATLTTVKPVDNNGASSTYIITDNKPVTGYNYYRIRSINNDGAIYYSTIVKVAIGVFKEYINIYPNPVMDGQVNVQFINEAAGKYGLRLLNNIGQVITEKQITREAGTNTELIKPNYSLARGIYELEVTKPDGSKKYLNVVY